jgi:hypothetical protein
MAALLATLYWAKNWLLRVLTVVFVAGIGLLWWPANGVGLRYVVLFMGCVLIYAVAQLPMPSRSCLCHRAVAYAIAQLPMPSRSCLCHRAVAYAIAQLPMRVRVLIAAHGEGGRATRRVMSCLYSVWDILEVRPLTHTSPSPAPPAPPTPVCRCMVGLTGRCVSQDLVFRKVNESDASKFAKMMKVCPAQVRSPPAMRAACVHRPAGLWKEGARACRGVPG